MLKILSWNIRQGGGSRKSSIIKSILSEEPQIIVLSEYRNNDSGIYLRNQLLQRGYRYQFVSDAKRDDHSVLVASTIPCNSILFPECDPHYAHSIIRVDFPAFNLYGMYLPHKKKHNLFPLLVRELRSEKPAILVGDFNTGINYKDQKGDSFWFTEYLKKFTTMGYHDAFRYLHGDVEEYSWYSHQGNGYRYDHTYVHESILPITHTCY